MVSTSTLPPIRPAVAASPCPSRHYTVGVDRAGPTGLSHPVTDKGGDWAVHPPAPGVRKPQGLGPRTPWHQAKQSWRPQTLQHRAHQIRPRARLSGVRHQRLRCLAVSLRPRFTIRAPRISGVGIQYVADVTDCQKQKTIPTAIRRPAQTPGVLDKGLGGAWRSQIGSRPPARDIPGPVHLCLRHLRPRTSWNGAQRCFGRTS